MIIYGQTCLNYSSFTILCLVGRCADQHFFVWAHLTFPNALVLEAPVYQRLYDTLGSASVPAVGRVVCFHSPVQQLVEGGGEGSRVLPDKLVGSDAPGFGVLGIGVEA